MLTLHGGNFKILLGRRHKYGGVKTMKPRNFVVVVLFFLVLTVISGFAFRAPETLAGIALGDSQQKVFKLLGKPQSKRRERCFQGDSGWVEFNWPAKGIVVGMGNGDEGVLYIEIYGNSKGKTSRGIGIGSTKEEVRAAYGNPDNIDKWLIRKDEDYMWQYGEDKVYIVGECPGHECYTFFAFRRGKVSSIGYISVLCD